MNTLRIYFSGQWRDASSSCEWALLNESGSLVQHGNSPLADIPKADSHMAILAPDRVLCCSIKMPPGSPRRWRAALPFLAEEHTLSDPEDIHVVPCPPQPDGMLPLLIVDKTWLRSIVDSCHAVGLTLSCAIPEFFLSMPPPSGHWQIVWDGSGGFVRAGSFAGMALDVGGDHAIPVALSLAMSSAEQNRPTTWELRFPHYLDHAAVIDPQWGDLPVQKGSEWDWRREPVAKDAPNLLWGSFAPAPKLQEWLPKLRPLALILFVVLSVEIVGTNVEWAMLAHERSQVTNRINDAFKTTFGESSSITNAPLQMKRNLAELRHAVGVADDSDFIPLLDQAAVALAELPNGSVRELNYEAGQLELRLQLPRAEDFKNLQGRLQENGLEVRMGKLAGMANATEGKLLLRRETRR